MAEPGHVETDVASEAVVVSRHDPSFAHTSLSFTLDATAALSCSSVHPRLRGMHHFIECMF